jgi:hypothetical protein
MSVSVGIYAQRKITEEDIALVQAHNTLVDQGYPIPAAMKAGLEARLGGGFDIGEPIKCPGGEFIEVWVPGEGDAMYGDGEVVKISDLPKGTFAIRVSAS